MNAWHGAIDLSGKSAAFAVMDPAGRLVIDAVRPMRGREAAHLAGWILEELESHDLNLEKITHWTVGSGPGSFTGMRLAAALVTGWSFQRPERHTRCVPSASIPAAECRTPEGAKIGVCFDGRNSEMLLFEMISRNGEPIPTGFTAVWDRETARKELNRSERFDLLCAPGDDLEALQRLLGEETAARICPCKRFSASSLLRATIPEFDNDLTRLVYIRPAVFTTPQ